MLGWVRGKTAADVLKVDGKKMRVEIEAEVIQADVDQRHPADARRP
jgi:hypothetical protein